MVYSCLSGVFLLDRHPAPLASGLYRAAGGYDSA